MEVIGLQRGVRESAKCEGLKLLSSIADRGRQFKELLCESFGENMISCYIILILYLYLSLVVKVVAECLAVSSSEETQELAQQLLHQLFNVSINSSHFLLILPPSLSNTPFSLPSITPPPPPPPPPLPLPLSAS